MNANFCSNSSSLCHQCQSLLSSSHFEQLNSEGLFFNSNDHDKSARQRCPFCVACQHDISSIFAYGAYHNRKIESGEDIRRIRVRKRSGESLIFHVVESSCKCVRDLKLQ